MIKLICTKCEKKFSANHLAYKCECGGLLDIEFTARFPIDEIKQRKPNLWRYREAIPIESSESVVSYDEGFTPIAGVVFHGKTVLIKQDQLFLTGSYKDRGAAVLISKVKELGVKKVVEDSSGNAGCAIAAYCAKAKINCDIYVPASNSAAKLVQIRSYGADLQKIQGNREDTAKAALKAAESTYYASHSWNPFFMHGTKTFAFEICEQLGWVAPDTVILPAGNGTLLLGAYLGFKELQQAKITNRIPKIIGIQSKNCNPLSEAFKLGLQNYAAIEKRETIAEGIAIAQPVRGGQILQAVKETNGQFIEVSEKEIQDSLRDICRKGFYIEPTSAAVIAGVDRYTMESDKHETIVSVFTGHGLKASEKILKILGNG